MARNQFTGRRYEAVTPSDTVNLSKGTADGFLIGGAGDIAIMGEDGDVVTMTAPAGILPCGGLRVYATGTTATGIVAIYT